jgi:hypothetical protein
MFVERTSDNIALASAVRSRVNADARIINAKAALWRLAGIGLVAAGIGAGAGMAAGASFFGYSFITDSHASAEKIADAITTALERVTLKTELLPGQKIAIDPASKVTIVGQTADDIPRPASKQMQTDARPASKANVVTNFTIFKSVTFGLGTVETGWNFADSDQRNPTHQYCSYVQPVDARSSMVISIGEDGSMKLPDKSPQGVDLRAAYANCVWAK